MKNEYADIRSKIEEQPSWFDENGTPRYCPFAPEHAADIYAEECCLLVIECQGCGRPFLVCLSLSMADRARQRLMFRAGARPDREPTTLAELIRTDAIHYGDPPNVSCCAAGPTMNSIPRRVVEFWAAPTASSKYRWQRVPELERPIKCDWAEDDS